MDRKGAFVGAIHNPTIYPGTTSYNSLLQELCSMQLNNHDTGYTLENESMKQHNNTTGIGNLILELTQYIMTIINSRAASCITSLHAM